jgi:hypothetical protein
MANFGVVMLVDELHLQCKLFQSAYAHLEDAADHWIQMSRGQDFDRKVPPLDILNWCTACLAAMSAIRHLLVTGRSDPVADERRRILREFLGSPQLQHVGSPVVRDSWEHLDERLDGLIPSLRTGSVSHVYVAATAPKSDQITLKRFDPVGFAIHFTDQVIPLKPAADEVSALLVALDEAFRRLASEIVLPWPHDVRAPRAPGA